MFQTTGVFFEPLWDRRVEPDKATGGNHNFRAEYGGAKHFFSEPAKPFERKPLLRTPLFPVKRGRKEFLQKISQIVYFLGPGHNRAWGKDEK